MEERVFNFAPGPAMLPTPVIMRIKEEFSNFKDMGASIIEISHRSSEFDELLFETDKLFMELANLPDNYRILYVHGGASLQFSAIPLNLMALKPARKALYFETGAFARKARIEAERYGDAIVAADSSDTNFDRIPEFGFEDLDRDASYVYITGNNTIYGTAWNSFPDTGEIPLVVDATSEILSREMDYSKFGLIFAGAQKNLGPSGLAMVIVREDLLGRALAETPSLLNYQIYDQKHSLYNTNNTFAIYVINLVLKWLKEQGGVAAIEKVNRAKAARLYRILDDSDFYRGHALPEHRSIMNVTFNLPSQDLAEIFLSRAKEVGLVSLKGHRSVGGLRASIYNAMPMEGVEMLADFMEDFERREG